MTVENKSMPIRFEFVSAMLMISCSTRFAAQTAELACTGHLRPFGSVTGARRRQMCPPAFIDLRFGEPLMFLKHLAMHADRIWVCSGRPADYSFSQLLMRKPRAKPLMVSAAKDVQQRGPGAGPHGLPVSCPQVIDINESVGTSERRD